jgi:hypothetical protein
MPLFFVNEIIIALKNELDQPQKTAPKVRFWLIHSTFRMPLFFVATK